MFFLLLSSVDLFCGRFVYKSNHSLLNFYPLHLCLVPWLLNFILHAVICCWLRRKVRMEYETYETAYDDMHTAEESIKTKKPN